MQKPKTIASHHIFSGRIIDVSTERLRYANGREYDLDYVRHPGAAATCRVFTLQRRVNTNASSNPPTGCGHWPYGGAGQSHRAEGNNARSELIPTWKGGPSTKPPAAPVRSTCIASMNRRPPGRNQACNAHA